MALSISPLSQVCKAWRVHLDSALNKPDRSKVNVVLGTPSEAASAAGTAGADHQLNLFFYRFEPAGLFPDTLPGEVEWLRGFCLVTPFALAEGSIGEGENDLRLLGEVLRIAHEQPVLQVPVDDDTVHLQVMLQPLGLDALNQLWSTQGDTVYRPSALFEVSLLPVVPATAAIAASLVGSFGLDVRAGLPMAGAGAPPASAPEVPPLTPDLRQPDWAPALTFVQAGQCAFSLSFVLGSAALAAFTPRVWLAGQVGLPVTLRWQRWDRSLGWQDEPASMPAVIPSPAIQPDAADQAPLLTLALPGPAEAGQWLLHAERSWTRPADGAVLTLRSNPLLVTLSPV
ncbi:MAG TPA: Pvc16 family protein [Ideonella sp.]|uniref:Pvc16 family protein n=1 Tax=Ideonella sp. TaxID=1929293 RepID=UPI002CC26D42|nr:Pvc16 family protein [Ideonella sp.]HSI51441.1 Pvc16 family protein [Ideonella sp.]